MAVLNHKFRVGVLMGGKSREREVSFNSGRTICDHIDIDRYEVIPIFQTALGAIFLLPLKFLHRGKTSDFEHRLCDEATQITWDTLLEHVDFIYIAVHGRYAEDGTLQGMLEVLGIPYLGSKVFASACGIDKVFQKKLLQDSGIHMPNGIALTPAQIKNSSDEQISTLLIDAGIMFPCIVKPAFEGSSLGISVVCARDELRPALEAAGWKEVTTEQPVLVEEKLEGLEFTCIAVKKDSEWMTLPLTEVVPEQNTLFYDYEQKYMPGRSCKITPARCDGSATKKIQEICVRASRVLEFETFFRTDGFLKPDGDVVLIDPNTLSGMGPASFLFHQAAEIGMNHTQLINHLINSELASYGLLDEIICYQERNQKSMKTNGTGGPRVKKRVVVLLGGPSSEREISLESGRNVCYKLSPSRYEVIPVFADGEMKLYKLSARLLIQNSTREIAQLVDDSMMIGWSDLPNLCDFVFIALHGRPGEDGSVQGALEMLGLPYNGPGILASSLCIDKYRTNCFLQKRGFVVPQAQLLKKEAWQEASKALLKTLSFPLIVKPPDDGCSMFVKKVCDEQELESVLREYFATGKEHALVEECVVGMELTCGVVGNEEITVFPPSYAVANAGVLSIKEKFLPGAGENQTPAPLPQAALQFVRQVVGDVYRVVCCKGYSRIDCFYQDADTSPTGQERVVILEINTLPGLTPATCLFHQAAEIHVKPMELIETIVTLGFDAQKKIVKDSDDLSSCGAS